MQIDQLTHDRRRGSGADDPRELLDRAAEDPWALSLGERRRLAAALTTSQDSWLRRLREMVEPPRPTGDFPAFLLDLPQFAGLRDQIAAADPVPTAAADQLQRFVDLYRDYLTREQPAGRN